MKVMKFAVGLAAGYVLGSRAGREKYEQIVSGFRTVCSHPAVQEAQQAAMDLLQVGKNTFTVEPVPETQGPEPTVLISTSVRRSPRHHAGSGRTTPSVEAGPQA